MYVISDQPYQNFPRFFAESILLLNNKFVMRVWCSIRKLIPKKKSRLVNVVLHLQVLQRIKITKIILTSIANKT